MAVRFYIGDRQGDGVNAPYFSGVERWVFQNIGITSDGQRQIISHCVPVTIDRYDLTVPQHNALMTALPTTQSFPATILPNTLGSLTNAQQTTIRNVLTNAGFSVAWATASTTIRQLIRAIADSVQLCEKISVLINQPLPISTFNVRDKTVGDLTLLQREKLLDILAALGVTANGTNATPLQDVVDAIRFAIKDFE